MKKLLAVLALVTSAGAAPAKASDVGVSISVGQPGFYGQLDVGGYGSPQVLYRQPVLVERRNWYPGPVYVRVPPHQYGNWKRYCRLYNACARPVYFVRDDWYRDVYAPRYRHPHGHAYGRKHNHDYAYERYDRRDDRYDDRRDDRRYDNRRDFDHGHGRH